MSSFIAVCVTFLGLTLIIVNVAVFLQMLLSFPAMLSSNSQAYVQQQRKLHHIPSSREDLDEDYAVAAEEEDEEDDDDQEWETTGRWADEAEDVEEQQYQADDFSPEAHVTPRVVVTAATARRSDSMTRGRPLRRQRRRNIARTVLRVKDIGRVRDSDYESEFSETEWRPIGVGARSRDRAGQAGRDCRGGWTRRGMDWTR
ncbi:hypothetical protein KVR01_005165 [Diaporthe batatas]|uniref:uncharacterized protein n=1 Tax=Diaporthe batatas TaxID=748121 RepID=UPI001D04703E|nr:uncharacterized protein KVR01_005165 [Diaporthe batatas]KAG8164890.1 hypothetical protein KVR01_005165 [Diaporthe batatas]